MAEQSQSQIQKQSDGVFVYVPSWTEISEKCYWLRLVVGRARFRPRINWAKLGLDRNTYERAFTPGVQKLLPLALETELLAVENMARACVRAFAIGNGPFGVLVAVDKWPELKEMLFTMPIAQVRSVLYESTKEYASRLRERPGVEQAWQTMSLRDRWFALRDEIVGNIRDLAKEVTDSCAGAMADIWRRRNNTAQLPDDFRDIVYQSILLSLPPERAIKSSWSFSVMLASVDSMTREAAERLSALEAEKQREIAEAAERGKMVESIVADMVRTRLQPLYTCILDGLEMARSGKVHPRWAGRAMQVIAKSRLAWVDWGQPDSVEKWLDELERIAKSSPARKENAAATTSSLEALAAELRKGLLVSDINFEFEGEAMQRAVEAATLNTEPLAYADYDVVGDADGIARSMKENVLIDVEEADLI